MTWSPRAAGQRLGQRRFRDRGFRGAGRASPSRYWRRAGSCRCRAALPPVSILISVVLPAPFGPTMPMRSPRWMRIEKSSTIVRSPIGLADALGLDHQLAGFVGFGSREAGVAGRAAIVAPLVAQRMQIAEPLDVALAAAGDAVAQPVLLVDDLAVELVLVALFLGQHLVAPGLECARSRGRSAGSGRDRARRWRATGWTGSGGHG